MSFARLFLLRGAKHIITKISIARMNEKFIYRLNNRQAYIKIEQFRKIFTIYKNNRMQIIIKNGNRRSDSRDPDRERSGAKSWPQNGG